ncbi:MAG: heavy metal-responsive transcriptional regulator [Verrucomicrobiota bacterium]|nr:heavy metal-responsive transcriptional regulator [Verrucomicrobiota bacterium]
MPANSEDKLLIGRLAELAGVKSDTIRFYERSGLLPRPERKASGYRVYDAAALKLVRFIKKAQALGFSLDEIRRVLSLRWGGEKTCDHVMAIAEATLEETERRLAELQTFRDHLKRTVASWKKPKRQACAAEFCALIESASPAQKGRRPSMLS